LYGGKYRYYYYYIYIYSVVDIHKLKLDCESIGHREQLMMIVLVGTII